MDRPIYETEDDLSREQQVAEKISAAWKCRFSKMPIRYHLDFVLTRENRAVAFCEIKVRNYTMEQINQMGGYMLSLGKWASAKALSEASNLPFVLVVNTTDGIWYSTIRNFVPDDVMIKGRTDRNDWQDIEPCVLLRCDRFKKLKT